MRERKKTEQSKQKQENWRETAPRLEHSVRYTENNVLGIYDGSYDDEKSILHEFAI